MNSATPVINGHELPVRAGGYLPFHYEITDWLRDGDNVLAVAVDSRWNRVPPEGNPKGPTSVDYLEPERHRPVGRAARNAASFHQRRFCQADGRAGIPAGVSKSNARLTLPSFRTNRCKLKSK